MNEVLLEVRSSPSKPGYNDTMIVIRDNHLRFACDCSGGPNHRQPRRTGGGPWFEMYGRIDRGIWPYECIEHPNYGKCLLINRADKVASRVANPNHNGNYYLTEIFVHSGYSDTWRGSAGCPVIHPADWDSFMRYFEVGEKGNFSVEDYAG